ncbi:MAG TPA: cobalamin-dependent protein, partial [Patescibacteria group bacterium]|nr:cobalamin-dependent protein [Patescibacteria group bacterium]
MPELKHIAKPTAEQKKKNSNYKIAISYPPMPSEKGVPLLTQNRQFQWFNNPTYIYPMVPAYAASLLQEHGYKVMWDDAIAEELTPEAWLGRIKDFGPDMIVFESKTPVIKRHWKLIDVIKEELPKATVVLIGDHVTAMPEESMEESQVDYILTGGDYDFLELNVANHLNHGEKLEAGIWYRESGKYRGTSTE